MFFSVPSRRLFTTHSSSFLSCRAPVVLSSYNLLSCPSLVSLKNVSSTPRPHSTSTRSFRSISDQSMPSTSFLGAKGTASDALGVKKVAPSRLVVCFDGTGNSFQGDTSDTNIVKLYEKFNRSDPNQFHYYQRKSLGPALCDPTEQSYAASGHRNVSSR